MWACAIYIQLYVCELHIYVGEFSIYYVSQFNANLYVGEFPVSTIGISDTMMRVSI